MYKLISIKKSDKPKKKYVAQFINTENKKIKNTYFGANGMSDYTIHKDKDRRNRYINRHKKDLETNDPTRAGYLAFILWSKPTLKESITFYRNLLKDYNKTKDIEKFKKALINS